MDRHTQPARRRAHIKPKEDRRLLGIGLILVAYLCFTGIDTSAKWLVISGVPSLEAVFARYAVHMLIVVAWFVPTYGPSVFETNAKWLEVARAMVLLASTVLNFFAVKYLPLTVTGSIVFAMPLVLAALSVPLLGERVGWRRWVAIIVGFAGVLVIIRPGTTSFHPAMLLSVGAVICYALYNITNRKLAGVDSAYTQQIYSGILAVLVISPFAFSSWIWPHDLAGWMAFFAMGVFGALGHLLVSLAHRLAEASILAPFVYPQILYMTASSYFVFGQAPDVWVFIGAPIVIGSGLYVWIRESRLGKRTRVQPL